MLSKMDSVKVRFVNMLWAATIAQLSYSWQSDCIQTPLPSVLSSRGCDLDFSGFQLLPSFCLEQSFFLTAILFLYIPLIFYILAFYLADVILVHAHSRMIEFGAQLNPISLKLYHSDCCLLRFVLVVFLVYILIFIPSTDI